MLPRAQTYAELVERFCWDMPAKCNMAYEVCDKWAKSEPERLAIIDLNEETRREITYGELKKWSDQMAAYLVELGVKRGDRIGVLRTQSFLTAIAHIAIWKMGGVSMPLFKLFGEDALKVRLADSAATAVMTDHEGAEALFDFHQHLPQLKNIIVAEDFSPDETIGFTNVETSPDDPAVLIYTSGTTGSPKGALHGHRVLTGHLPGVEMSHNLFPKENDCIWTPADWAWIGGLFDVLMPALYHGVPVIASRMTKFSAMECKKIIETNHVTNVFMPPTALKILKAEDVSINGLRSVASGGEPLGEEMLNWGKKAFGLTINEFYGQTECNMVVSSCSELFAPKPGKIGKPVPGHDVAIVDEHGEPTGAEGDIAIRRGTPVMMIEYWNNPSATSAKFRRDRNGDEWLITGDRGIMDGEFIRFVGRDDDVITSGGYRIGPAEIEDCLITHPAVMAAGVIGKPDALRTEIVKAYVKLRKGYAATDELRSELQAHVKNRLAKHEYPREIEFLEELPMTITGKIIRKELKRRAADELTASDLAGNRVTGNSDAIREQN